MHRLLACLSFALFATAAMPVHAAENLDCATSLIDPKLSKAVFKAYRADKDLGDVVLARVGKQLTACTIVNDWSQATVESVFRVMFGQILLQGLQPDFDRLGIAGEAMTTSTDLFLSTMPRTSLRQFVDGEVSPDMGAALVRHFLVNKVIPAERLDERLGGLIGEFAAARGNMTYFTEQFARQ